MTDINYNLNYLVIAPNNDSNFFNDLAFTFKNVISFDGTIQGIERIIKFLRNNTVGTLIFVDYFREYEEIINTLVEEHEIKFIFTKSLGGLSDQVNLASLNMICDKYDKKIINEIGFLDGNLYNIMRVKRRGVKHILIDTPIVKSKYKITDKTIGLLNSDSSDYDSFYNEMAATSFLTGYKVKVLDPTEITKDFSTEFGIQLVESKNLDDLVNSNECNLYINFAGSLPNIFIKSMDNSVPCIVGNNDFLKNYPILQKYLVVKSDDSVDEIFDKLNSIKNDTRRILNEYKVFREEYSKLSKKSIEDFLEEKIDGKTTRLYDKILTVIVPVYNTSKYLAKCLDSVIAAQIPDMEILVINDGSTDNSDKIIEQYIRKYPDLIRYIKKKNGGLGSVRNVGLAKANGKYLASVDSDDTIEPEFFQQALKYMKEDVDIVLCDWMSISNGEIFETSASDWIFRNQKEFLGIMYTTIMPSTCNKIIKNDIFRKNKIRYLEQKYEDLSANPLALLSARTIKYLKKPYYNYYLRDNSLMRSKINPRQMIDVLAFLDSKISKTRMNLDIVELKYYTYSWRIEEYILNPLYELDGKELTDAVKYLYDNLYEIVIELFDNVHYKKMLSGLKNKDKKEFIEIRNRTIKDKNLEQFLKKNKSNPQKLNAGIIYYGE